MIFLRRRPFWYQKIWKKFWNFQKPVKASNLNILKIHGRSKKNQNVKIISNGACNMRNDGRIPNLAPEFRSDNIWHPFWPPPKKLLKWAKLDIKPIWAFFAIKGFKCYPIRILRRDLESSHFAYYKPPFDVIFTFWFSDLPCIFTIFKLLSQGFFE